VDTTDTSYWHASFQHPTTSAPLPTQVEVAVIGGGWLGCCTAYWLARRGVRVALLEKNLIAAGASGRNGGFITEGTAESYPNAIQRLGHAAAKAVWQLTIENRKLVRQVLAEEQIDGDYREIGNLSLALSEAEYAHMGTEVHALQNDGWKRELLDRRQVQELIATPLGLTICGGSFAPETALVHSARLINGMATAAQQHGTTICTHVQVEQLQTRSDLVSIQTNRGTLEAGQVVVAVNAWSDELVPALRGLIVPVRGQALAYAPTDSVFRCGMGTDVTPTGEYWQQTTSGAIVLGGCRAVAPDRDVHVRSNVPTNDVQQALEQVFPSLFPQLRQLYIQQRWAGLMAFTPDYLPIADRAPGIPHTWVVGGFCGHGMPFGMILGSLLAEAATTKRAPSQLAPLRIDRPTLRKEIAQ
jgi:glycine/D-amino acid oxidase-like deaminating enzyme